MKKILTIIASALFALYLLFSVVVSRSGAEKYESDICQGMVVDVKNRLGYDLIDNAAIDDILAGEGIDVLDKKMSDIDVEMLERTLVMNPLIHSVDCYKTNGNKILVDLVTKVPILRVINNRGEDFYVDSDGGVIGADIYPLDIPLATGYVDSIFASEKLYDLAMLLQESEFWNAQIAQINVTKHGQVELVPRVGNHLLVLGDPSEYDHKLNRLVKFYEEGLDVIGWNKYSSISVAYDNQVVCKKK